MTCVVIPNKTQQKFHCHSERSEAEWRISSWLEILPSSEWQAQVEPISWFVIISGLSFWTQRSGVKNLFLVYKSFFDNSWDSSFVRITCVVITKETQQKFHCHSERSEAEWRISSWLEILPSSEWQAQVEPISWFVIISGLSFWTQRSGVKNLILIGDSSFVRMTSAGGANIMVRNHKWSVILNAAKRSEESLFGLQVFFDNSWDSSFVRMTSVVIPNETQQKFHCHSERSEAEWRIPFWFTSLFLTILEILPSSEWQASSFLTKRSRNSTVILNAAERSEESLYDWRFFLRQNDREFAQKNRPIRRFPVISKI